MNLVIYGVNDNTLEIIRCIKKTNRIVAISDSFLDEKKFKGYAFVKKDELIKIDFDYIIVCVKTRKTFEEIKKSLVCIGIEKKVILSFCNLFYESRVDQVMLEAKAHNIKFDGIIIGISHAAYAINPHYLKGCWGNIAVPSEDIINHNLVFDKLLKEYIEQICNVNRIIIDLYDYSVLNFFTSYSHYSTEFYDLYCGDGIEYQDKYREIEQKINNRNNYSSSYAREHRTIRREIFDEERVFSNYKNHIFESPTPIDFYYKECVYCENEISSIENGISYIPKIQRDENIEKNIIYLNELVKKIYDLNPMMKVHFVFIPRIAELEQKNGSLVEYKKIIYKEIDELMKCYPGISLHDYKGINEISMNRKGYCSVGHMNNIGQKLFTKQLCADIFERVSI